MSKENPTLQEKLDLAIGKEEGLKGGFKTKKGVFYNNYLTNSEWEIFKANMDEHHRKQYGAGGGGELEEKNGSHGWMPPKMASFGSSSRFIYKLSKDIPGFIFEEQLDTRVGGIANLDGFLSQGKKNIYVEAKRREIYTSHDKEEIKMVYENVYDSIPDELVRYDIIEKDIHKKEGSSPVMKGIFYLGGRPVPYFDLKQLICHFLGITYDLAKSKTDVEEVQFLYLVYNPTRLEEKLYDTAAFKTIQKGYKETTFADDRRKMEYVIEKVFYAVLDYQISRNKLIKPEVKFSFKIVDQDEYLKYFE